MNRLLMIVFMLALICGSAQAVLITGVVRSNGQSGTRDPIGVFDGSTAPLAMQAGGLKDGNLVYSDRTYPWINTPATLVGAEYIRTFNTDKAVSETNVTYAVTLGKPAMLAITIDDRIPAEWNNGGLFTSQQDAINEVVAAFAAPGTFTDTGLDVYIKESATTNRPISVYAAQLPAGTYVFGAQPADRNFYTIGAVPEPATIALLGFGGLTLLRSRKRT